MKSAMGQKRNCRPVGSMSAFPSRTDIRKPDWPRPKSAKLRHGETSHNEKSRPKAALNSNLMIVGSAATNAGFGLPTMGHQAEPGETQKYQCPGRWLRDAGNADVVESGNIVERRITIVERERCRPRCHERSSEILPILTKSPGRRRGFNFAGVTKSEFSSARRPGRRIYSSREQ
jgi:hypothetical protein